MIKKSVKIRPIYSQVYTATLFTDHGAHSVTKSRTLSVVLFAYTMFAESVLHFDIARMIKQCVENFRRPHIQTTSLRRQVPQRQSFNDKTPTRKSLRETPTTIKPPRIPIKSCVFIIIYWSIFNDHRQRKINRKMQNSTQRDIVTPVISFQNFAQVIMSERDYPPRRLWFQSMQRGLLSKLAKYYRGVAFSSVLSYPFLIYA